MNEVLPEADSAPRLSPSLVSILLSPLPFSECLRLEGVCQLFRDNIYRQQTSFIWNRKHRQFLIDNYGVNERSESFETLYLKVASRKIGPYCRHLRLKMYRMFPNAIKMLGRFTQLRSLWIQNKDDSASLREIFAKPDLLSRDSLRHLRVMLLNSESLHDGWLPVSFRWWLSHHFHLQTLAIWRAEAQFQKSIFKLAHLNSLSLHCDESGLRFFESFSLHVSSGKIQLRHLTVKWTVDELNRTGNFTQFMIALGKLKMESLNLQVHWNKVIASDSVEEQAILSQWMNYMSSRIARTVRCLSLSVDCVTPGSVITAAAMIHTFTFAMEHLQLLQLKIIDPASFPLQIGAHQVDNLDLQFKYQKKMANPEEKAAGFFPKCTGGNRERYLFRKFRNSHSLQSLRLSYCVVTLNGDLLSHLIHWFPLLEQFHVSGAYAFIYPDKLDNQLGEPFLEKMTHLRVLTFTDSFLRLPMKATVRRLLQRAQENEKKAYRFVGCLGSLANNELDEELKQLARVKNFRVH